MKICNVCKTVLEDSAAYCPRCNGQSFSPFQTKRCPFCNSTVAVGTIVCPNCHKILPPEEYVEMKFAQPVVQPIYVAPVEAPKAFVPPKLAEDFVAPEVPKEPVVEKASSPASSYDFAKGHEFNPFERPIERKEDSEPLDNIILESENENFGRPEQYAELFPNEIPPINKSAYDLSAYEKTPFKPIAVKDTLDNLEDDNQMSGKVVGFSESSAKLNAKINSKISKNEQENKKKNKNGKNETDRLFGEINRQFDSEELEPEVMSREEAEKQNLATQTQKSDNKKQPSQSNNSEAFREMGLNDDNIVKNAFSNLSGERTVYKNDGGSPTYIYNQIFPNQNAEQRQQSSSVFENTVNGTPNISTVNEKGAKPIRQRTAGSGIAVLLSLVFIIGGLALSLFLVDINFYYDKITGIQLAAASLGQTVFDMFPSNYWELSFNGFLSGLNLTFYEFISPLYLASVITSVVAIVTHLFCFTPGKAKKTILLVFSSIIFGISLAITLALLFIFNFATIGYGIMIFAFASLLSLLTLIIGYKNKV